MIVETAVTIRNLNKVFEVGDVKIEVLKNINIDVLMGEFIALCGASGAGKTTLLNLISGIDKPTTGIVRVFGEDLLEKNEDELSELRACKIGFVFQTYNLVTTLTVAENIAFPMEWLRKSAQDIETRVTELLKNLGLQHRQNHFPAQLSGGEQQRVALARALANNPSLFLADEPTGNLDTANAQKIVGILDSLRNEGKTIIVSTHDERIMQLATRVFHVQNSNVTDYDGSKRE